MGIALERNEVTMSVTHPLVQAEPLHVLTIQKRLPDQRAVARELAALLPQVEDVLSGAPMAVRLGFPRDGQALFDLAFPVAGPVERNGFKTKTLTAFPAFSIRHEGPLANGPEGTNLGDTVSAFVSFLQESGVMLGDDPVRFVYHAGLETVGTEAERFALEMLYAYHTPIWLDALRSGVRACLTADAAGRVLAGSEDLAETFDGSQAAAWVQGAISRLDEEVESEESKASILNACAHHYIVESALEMQAAWNAADHDLRRLIASLGDHPYFGADYRLDESSDAPILYITRPPANRTDWEEATNPSEKRYYGCFCPLVRDAIRSETHVSRTFCHCSAGWFVQEWQLVFGRPPKVALVQTLLDGSDACVFAVHVPEGVLE